MEKRIISTEYIEEDHRIENSLRPKLLSEYIEHDKLVCFGDNLNDIPMFELADECYATSNAVEKVKCISTDVIGSCDEDGVALFIEKRLNELKIKS